MEWNQINIEFGNILRQMREARGMTQEQFSAYCSISRAYYGRLERGEHSITLDLCKKISDALGITLSDLFKDLLRSIGHNSSKKDRLCGLGYCSSLRLSLCR